MDDVIKYSLYNHYFGENYVYRHRHTEMDRKIKDVAKVNQTQKQIHIIDKDYNNDKFINWLLNKHPDYEIKEAL